VVENRPGGASNIGARACAEAPPDGYTICIMPGEPLAYNKWICRNTALHPVASNSHWRRFPLYFPPPECTFPLHRATS
jgi:Tripartite tricarboxylate transporter family receptor